MTTRVSLRNDNLISLFSIASLASARKTLLEFLRTSLHYSGDKILKALPPNDLFEERAIVLAKLRNHDACLTIYIQILGDPAAAAAYCAAVYAEEPKNDSIYVSLVEKLLQVPTVSPYLGVPLHASCQRPDMDFVLELLERHAERFNAKAVLQLLPDNVTIHRLKPFLERALQHQLRRQTEAQVIKGLMYAEHQQLQEELAALCAKCVVLTEQTVCPECGKKFSNQSTFVRMLNGNIVHYSCQPSE